MLGYGVFVRGMVFAIACAVTACETDEQPPPRAPRNLQVRSEVGILVVTANPDGGQLKAATEHALVHAGYRVVASPDEPHELVAQLDVSITQKHSIVTLYVNGEAKKHYAARASISVLGKQRVLAVETLDYDVDDGPSREALAALVNAVGGAPVTRYLTALKQKQANDVAAIRNARADEEDEKEAAELAKRRDVKRREKAAWAQIVLSECSSPTRVEGCEAVKQFLTLFPDSKHGAEAKNALEVGSILVSKLADDRDWTAAHVELCRDPKASTDCEGVSAYLGTHPSGLHQVEARAALIRSQKKRDEIEQAANKKIEHDAVVAAQEEKRAAALEAQEEKRAERAQCKKNCIGDRCFAVRPGAFEICMDRCVKANCD